VSIKAWFKKAEDKNIQHHLGRFSPKGKPIVVDYHAADFKDGWTSPLRSLW